MTINNYHSRNLWTGTAAERAALVNVILGDRFYETDTELLYWYDAAWYQIGALTGTEIRALTSLYRRYYHVPLGSANPGGSGATFINADANTTGGWRITAAAQIIRGQVDIHADWDGASDPKFEVHFCTNVDNSLGGAGDTVDLRINVYYKGMGDTATKTQAVEVATVIGAAARYKQFEADFTINRNAPGNILDVGDIISVVLNIETDTSEVDDVIVTAMEFYYQTTHVGIESGDV